MLIVVMYLFREIRVLQIMLGIVVLMCFSSLTEVFAMMIIPCVLAYNGERGVGLKYFFYAFYPVHLAIIYVVAVLLGVNFWFI